MASRPVGYMAAGQAEEFGSSMRVVISGSSGLVGKALTISLESDGHTVSRMVRPGEALKPGDVSWNPNSALVDVGALEGCDAFVNLNGAGIGDKRWTDERKKVLRNSRIDATRVLVEALSRLKRKPAVFVSSSAVGIYGNRGDEVLVESFGNANDFLGILARSWEGEANRARIAGIRTTIMRFGIILDKNHGALAHTVRPIKLGVGGRFGNGKQWVSWIALSDVVRVIRTAIDNTSWRGPINVASPNPVRNEEFVRTIARVLHRPAALPAPAFALRFALGEMADALLLSSQRAKPEFLVNAGFQFQYEQLEPALREILL
jgi:uncharacterized protein (TIGR01777 family)